MPRHQLTTEERRKGAAATNVKLGAKRHKFTQEDCREGALKVALRIRTGRLPSTARHTLTPEERRKGGLVTAAKRRQKRLEDIYLGGQERIERVMAEAGKMGPGIKVTARNRAEVNEKTAERAAALPPEPLPPVDVKAMAEKLMSGGGAKLCGICKRPLDVPGDPDSTNCGGDCRACTEEVERDNPPMTLEEVQALASPLPDPFTLSALKRFRLGPLSPLTLTRSQRAHVDIMLAGGWVEKTPEAMIRLTAKGEAALNATENE